MVIVNPSALVKNELDIMQFKKGVVLVSPRLVSWDSDPQHSPEVNENDD